MSLNCIIIDDEPDAIDLLALLIRQNTEWNIKSQCYDALEALAFLRRNTVDFVFLDINMPQLSGMELAALLSPGTGIVFTTGYSEYAVESYTYQTIDYLLKPITLKRFLASMLKIESYFQRYDPAPVQPAASVPASASEQDYFFVKSGKAFRKILLKNILYFEGESEYVRLVTSQEQLLIYRRLKDIEEQLRPPFLRVHNSYIINYEKLVKLEDNHIYIADKRIPVSRKFRESFMEVINKRRF